MGQTDTYRRQHEELLLVGRDIAASLDVSQLVKDAKRVRELLSTLAGKLNMHLAMEDKALYPRLAEHEKPEVRATAKRFIDEMGGLKDAFGKYAAKWNSSIPIQNNPSGFVSETRGVLDALSRRIEKENNELYALVDRL